MRVVAIIPGDQFSGPAGQVASTGEALARVGVELRLLLLCRPGTATGQLPAFLEKRRIPFDVVPDYGPFDVSLPLRVHKVLGTWRPAIVETHGYKASAVALSLRPFRRWRWIGYVHGFTTESRRARFYYWLDQHVLAVADAAVLVSEQHRRMTARRLPHARVVPNAVTELDHSTDDILPWLGDIAGLGRPRIAVVGRLSPEKGVDVFLEGVALLVERGVACTAVIVGDGPERGVLEQLAKHRGLADRVRFLGYLTQIRPLYDHVDLIVIPSRSEGLPSVLLEALAADAGVVATRVGSIPDVLGPGEAGILVNPGSPRDLADGIQVGLARLHDPATRLARAAAVARFSQDARAQALVSLYREVLGLSPKEPHAS